jgi:diguanylate cyclase (GGDEF)-like protein
MNEIRVLHFEDVAADRLFAAASLGRCTYAHFSVRHVARLKEGLAQLAAHEFDAILLDLGLPDSQGQLTFERVHQAAPNTPILVLTGRDDDATGAALVKAGAQDYLPKRELTGGMLARSIHYAIERKELQAALRQLALHDALTGLANRTLLVERARQVLALCERDGRLAVAYIDLDNFKQVNDEYGHEGGDELLKAVAARVSAMLRPADTLARLGGDEFVVLAPQMRGRQDATLIARKLLTALSQPFPIAERSVTVTASIGIALYPEHGNDFGSLMAAADAAMYRSKLEAKNGYVFAEGTDASNVPARATAERRRQPRGDGAA